jgi:hypothetical protein
MRGMKTAPTVAPAGAAQPRNRIREWPVAVGVELGELAVDVDGVGAVEVHVLVVGGPDVRQHFVVDLAAFSAKGTDGQAVVLRRPTHDGVGGQGQAPHLLRLLFVVAPAQQRVPGLRPEQA